MIPKNKFSAKKVIAFLKIVFKTFKDFFWKLYKWEVIGHALIFQFIETEQVTNQNLAYTLKTCFLEKYLEI